MIKKFISLILIFALTFSFASCGIKEETEITTTEPQVKTVKVTIPEGYTIVRIDWLLRDKGICKEGEFIEATQNYTDWLDLTQYPFLNDLQDAQNVCFKLEGYIFPLTYDIPENATVYDIVKIFLNGTKQKFTQEFLNRVGNSGYTLHEVLTMASMIEKEAALSEQRPMIASVIYNRLNKKMKLEFDSTRNYCTKVIELIYPQEIDHYKFYYNTYRCDALMAGPMCNPGMESIEAVLTPASTDYLYFIIGTVPPYESYFSKTHDEHYEFWQENKDRLTGKATTENANKDTYEENYW